MGVGEDFRTFCGNLTINNASSISTRYKLITRRLNLEYWNTDSNTSHSFYAGSYGRGTAIRGFSDLDMIFQLPYDCYERFDNHIGNGQSALLQEVRRAMQKTYPTSHIGGDGQVVAVAFKDDITFEVVPAFLNKDKSYTYPDSNNGGRWRVTNPLPEIAAIKAMDQSANGNLKWLCRMMRAWKSQWSVPMGGLLIDTLAHNFIRNWANRDKSFLYYDFMSRDFFAYLIAQDTSQTYWQAPGSAQYVWKKGEFQYKAKRCYNISLQAIQHESNNQTWSARQRWREIYGTAYPT